MIIVYLPGTDGHVERFENLPVSPGQPVELVVPNGYFWQPLDHTSAIIIKACWWRRLLTWVGA